MTPSLQIEHVERLRPGASHKEAPVLFLGFRDMAKFGYDDTVRVLPSAPRELRPGMVASVIGIEEEPRSGAFFEQFPPGTVYLVEYEGGDAASIHESHLEWVR